MYYDTAITYGGNISAVYHYPTSVVEKGCPTAVTLGPYPSATLQIGQRGRPSWDKNPYDFWFMTNDTIGFVTGDNVNSLVFTSAVAIYRNYSDKGTGVQMLDLGGGPNSATVERSQVGGETGYVISGDEKTFTGNSSFENAVEIVSPEYKDALSPCIWLEYQFIFDQSNPFNYSITISNATSIVTIWTNTSDGALSLEFNGTRNDDGLVELDTSNPNLPVFRVEDGSSSSTGINSTATAAKGTSNSPFVKLIVLAAIVVVL